jgi:hypothetical protein
MRHEALSETNKGFLSSLFHSRKNPLIQIPLNGDDSQSITPEVD